MFQRLQTTSEWYSQIPLGIVEVKRRFFIYSFCLFPNVTDLFQVIRGWSERGGVGQDIYYSNYILPYRSFRFYFNHFKMSWIWNLEYPVPWLIFKVINSDFKCYDTKFLELTKRIFLSPVWHGNQIYIGTLNLWLVFFNDLSKYIMVPIVWLSFLLNDCMSFSALLLYHVDLTVFRCHSNKIFKTSF